MMVVALSVVYPYVDVWGIMMVVPLSSVYLLHRRACGVNVVIYVVVGDLVHSTNRRAGRQSSML